MRSINVCMYTNDSNTSAPRFECRLVQTGVKAWVLFWYCQASGKLIAARHRRILAATAVQALAGHAQHCRKKYALLAAAARHWKRAAFRAFAR